MNDRKSSVDKNILSRVHNGWIGAMCDQPILPKIVAVVIDDDIIKYLKKKEKEDNTSCANREGFERVLKWLMCQFDRLIITQKDFLPAKAKRNGEPAVIWIEPPTHRNFKSSNNDL